jgi:hypothetical protein
METTNTENRNLGKAIYALFAVAAVVAALLAAALTSQPAHAHGTDRPYHTVTNPVCQIGPDGTGSYRNQVIAYPPYIMKGYSQNWEKGYWSVDLQMYFPLVGWVTVDNTAPWRAAWISSTYYQNRFDHFNQAFVWSGDNLPGINSPGSYYRLKTYFYWGSNGANHVQYSGYCQSDPNWG